MAGSDMESYSALIWIRQNEDHRGRDRRGESESERSGGREDLYFSLNPGFHIAHLPRAAKLGYSMLQEHS